MSKNLTRWRGAKVGCHRGLIQLGESDWPLEVRLEATLGYRRPAVLSREAGMYNATRGTIVC